MAETRKRDRPYKMDSYIFLHTYMTMLKENASGKGDTLYLEDFYPRLHAAFDYDPAQPDKNVRNAPDANGNVPKMNEAYVLAKLRTLRKKAGQMCEGRTFPILKRKFGKKSKVKTVDWTMFSGAWGADLTDNLNDK